MGALGAFAAGIGGFGGGGGFGKLGVTHRLWSGGGWIFAVEGETSFGSGSGS